MAKRRGVRWLLIALAVVLAAAAVVLYLLNVAPGRYEPMVLDGAQQDQAMHAFVNQVSDFGDKAGAGESFTWSITARQINAYLGAMDAIASLPYDKPQRPSERLLQAGLAAPAVSMRDGVVTLMVYSTRLKKVISMDVTPEFDADGTMTLRAGGVRVGMIPVPQALVDKELTRVRGELGRRLRAATQNDPERQLGPVAVSRVGPMLITILDMLDGKYVRAEIVWPVNHHRVRVTKVEIGDGALTIHGSPVQPTSGEAATSRRTATRVATRSSREPGAGSPEPGVRNP